MKWEEKRIEDLCDLVVDCVNRTAPKVDHQTPYKMIRTTNVRNGRIDLDNAFYVDQPTFERWIRRGKPEMGDILLTREAPVGEVGILRTDDEVFLGQRIVMYRACESKVHNKFLYYSLQSEFVQAQIQAFASGSTVAHVKVPHTKELLIRLPPLPTQHRIASILSAYDDLIENNLKRIRLLEEAAQHIYREWFVEMRFPGCDQVKWVEDEGGRRLPEGWKRVTIGDIMTLNYGKGLRKDDRVQTGQYPVYGSAGIVGYHDKYLVKAPGIILGRKGNVGSTYFSQKDFYPIDTVYFITTDHSLMFAFHLLRNETFINTDAAVPGLNRNYACSKSAVLPTQDILHQFDAVANPIYSQIGVLTNHSSILQEARDILLPRLMNRTIEV